MSKQKRALICTKALVIFKSKFSLQFLRTYSGLGSLATPFIKLHTYAPLTIRKASSLNIPLRLLSFVGISGTHVPAQQISLLLIILYPIFSDLSTHFRNFPFQQCQNKKWALICTKALVIFQVFSSVLANLFRTWLTCNPIYKLHLNTPDHE